MNLPAFSSRRPLGLPTPDEREVRRRLAAASTQLVALRSELSVLQADLAWLQLIAAGGPDLDTGDAS